MPPAVAIAGAAVVGAGAQLAAGSKAAKAQREAAAQQVAEQRRQYDQDRQDLAPWRAAGSGALGVLSRYYGLDGQPADQSVFTGGPDYAFIRDESLRAIDRNRAARGLLNSGAADKARMDRASGLASTDIGNWYNRMAGIAGIGQNAVNTGIQAGQNTTNQITNAIGNAGNARASSYANTGSAINSGSNNVLSAYLFSRGGGFGGKGAF